MTTTPHPAPEERYEAAVNALKLREWNMEAGPSLREAMIAAIREAEAAGEAKSDEVLIRVLASLAAAISLLERTPKAKKAAPSDKMFEQMLTDYRNALEAGRAFILARTDKEPSTAALSASGTKSDGGGGGAQFVEGYFTDQYAAGAKPPVGPSDPIPSQPDERERVKQVIESAMIEEAEIQYADFTDRDRQREKIITSAADAILAMQAERRGDNTIQRDKIYRAAERSNTRFGQWIPERWVNIFVEEMSK